MNREEKISTAKELQSKYLNERSRGLKRESLITEREYLVIRKELIDEVTTEVKSKKSINFNIVRNRVKNRKHEPKRETGIRVLDTELVHESKYGRGDLGGFSLGNFIQIAGERGAGKALSVNEKILTPNGWAKNGEIKIGDYVIGSNGKKTKVLGTYPQGLKDIYEVTFIDGTSVKCDIDHIWTVFNRKNKMVNMTTREILNSTMS